MSNPNEMIRSGQLTHPQAKFLGFVFGHQDHRIDFDQSKYRPDALAMVQTMIGKGLLKVVELVQHALALRGRVMLQCTDLGVKIAGELAERANGAQVIRV